MNHLSATPLLSDVLEQDDRIDQCISHIDTVKRRTQETYPDNYKFTIGNRFYEDLLHNHSATCSIHINKRRYFTLTFGDSPYTLQCSCDNALIASIMEIPCKQFHKSMLILYGTNIRQFLERNPNYIDELLSVRDIPLQIYTACRVIYKLAEFTKWVKKNADITQIASVLRSMMGRMGIQYTETGIIGAAERLVSIADISYNKLWRISFDNQLHRTAI